MPTHRVLDAAYEAAKGKSKVGTTGKGIGPTYTDKISRNGLRVGDIFENFQEKYAQCKARHEAILKSMNYEYDITEVEKKWMEGIEYLRTFNIVDSEHEINGLLREGKSILCHSRLIPYSHIHTCDKSLNLDRTYPLTPNPSFHELGPELLLVRLFDVIAEV